MAALNPAAVKAANEALWKAHPELQGRQLTLEPADAAYRKEWIAYYKAASEGKSLSPTPVGTATQSCPVAPQKNRSVSSIFEHDSQGNLKFTPSGDPIAMDPRRAGPATLQPGFLTTTNGLSVRAYKNLSPNNIAWNCDCHGNSIAEGKYWIDDKDMQDMLDAQTQNSKDPLLVPTKDASVGNLVVYYDANGDVVHSAVITSPGEVTMAAGTVIYPGNSKTTTVPINEGWTAPGTTIRYWRLPPPK